MPRGIPGSGKAAGRKKVVEKKEVGEIVQSVSSVVIKKVERVGHDEVGYKRNAYFTIEVDGVDLETEFSIGDLKSLSNALKGIYV